LLVTYLQLEAKNAHPHYFLITMETLRHTMHYKYESLFKLHSLVRSFLQGLDISSCLHTHWVKKTPLHRMVRSV